MTGEQLRAEAYAFPIASLAALRREITVLACDPVGNAARETDALRRDFKRRAEQISRSPLDQIEGVRAGEWHGRGEVLRSQLPLHEFIRAKIGALFPPGQAGTSEDVSVDDAEILFWNQLCILVSPDLFIADLALRENNPALIHVPRVRLSLPRTVVAQGFTEQHVHLGACLPFNMAWAQALTVETLESIRQDFENVDLRGLLAQAALVRGLLGMFLAVEPHSRGISLRQFLVSLGQHYPDLEASDGPRFLLEEGKWLAAEEVARSLLAPATAESRTALLDGMLGPLRLLEDQLRQRARGEDEHPADYLLTVFNLGLGPALSTAEPLLLYHALRYLETQPDDRLFAKHFWQLIRCKNLFYQRLVQQGTTRGLAYFSRFFENAKMVGRFLKQSKLEVADRHLNPDDRLVNLEVRAGPAPRNGRGRGFESQAKEFLDFLRQYKRILARSGSPPRMGLTVHFIKGLPCDQPDVAPRPDERIDPNPDVSHEALVRDEGQPVGGCTDNIRGRQYRHRDYFLNAWKQMLAIDTCLKRAPELACFFRGIDVAAQERQLPNWIFAHLFQEFRQRTSPRGQQSPLYPMRFTAHVGEDFLHPIGGLRRIHEGVRFLELGAGDRLGHAIALGVDLDGWAREHPTASVSLADYMDDLAWQWLLLRSWENLPALAHPVRIGEALADEFRRLTSPLRNTGAYCEVHALDFTLAQWAEAYEQRHDPAALERIGVLDRDDSGLASDASARRPGVGGNSWDRALPGGSWRVLESYFYCGKLWKSIRRMGNISVTIDDAYLERARVIQSWLQQTVIDFGLTVEVCPTSNVRIAGIDDYALHPAFVLAGPCRDEARQPVQITLNADDPVTFNAFVETEIGQLYHAYDRIPATRLRQPNMPTATQWISERLNAAHRTTFAITTALSPLEAHRHAVETAIEKLADGMPL